MSAVITYRFSLYKVLSHCSHASGRVIYSYNKISLSIGSSNCCAGQENAQKGHGRIPFGEGNTPYVRQVVAAPYFKRLLEVVKRHNVQPELSSHLLPWEADIPKNKKIHVATFHT